LGKTGLQLVDWETVETVGGSLSEERFTLLKQGVNERGFIFILIFAEKGSGGV
jgi:hypothetical protein